MSNTIRPVPQGYESWEAYHRDLGCYDCKYAIQHMLGVGPCCSDPPDPLQVLLLGLALAYNPLTTMTA